MKITSVLGRRKTEKWKEHLLLNNVFGFADVSKQRYHFYDTVSVAAYHLMIPTLFSFQHYVDVI
jgi:hypothetical protein